MTVELLPGWSLAVDRGPDWLFVRPIPLQHGDTEEVELAEAIWELCEQHLTYRVVLEFEEVAMLRSWLVGQLVLLKKRLCSHEGLLRICHLSDNNQMVLKICRLDAHFPQYQDRCAAVMGEMPHRPR